MEFIIDLPERLSFCRNWQVTLKSLFIPNKIHNVVDCYFKFYYYNWKHFDYYKAYPIHLTSKHCSTMEALIDNFNRALEILTTKIRCRIVDGKVVMKYDTWTEWKYSRKLILSPNLDHIFQ